MNVLDPFEVAEIEMWPLWDLENAPPEQVKQQLAHTEFTIYQAALRNSGVQGATQRKGYCRFGSHKTCPRRIEYQSSPRTCDDSAITPIYASLAALAPSQTWLASSASASQVLDSGGHCLSMRRGWSGWPNAATKHSPRPIRKTSRTILHSQRKMPDTYDAKTRSEVMRRVKGRDTKPESTDWGVRVGVMWVFWGYGERRRVVCAGG